MKLQILICFLFLSGDVLRHITQYISNCPSALGSTLPYDEASLVAKITQHLNTTAASSGVSGSRSNSSVFLNLHEQLKASVSKADFFVIRILKSLNYKRSI